jgi:predicted dehydrogenase
MNDVLRIGTLGAARITPTALLKPARKVSRVAVVAVAARDRAKAERFAAKRRIPKVHNSYDDLLADPDIDAVYNPLPNSHHARWTLRALEAGKHVLCEKPFTANAQEAETVAKAAAATGLVVMEAFHSRHHPLAARALEIVRSGELGTIRHVDTRMIIPLLKPGDIRYRLELAGGATMDVGCYALSLLRLLGGPAEPEVIGATAKESSPGVDRYMQADLRFPEGHTADMTCALASGRPLSLRARVTGSAGMLRIINPFAPQYGHRLTVDTTADLRREYFGRETTYVFQLRAFVAAVLDGGPVLTDTDEAIANMRVIDDVYRAAGMAPRVGVAP